MTCEKNVARQRFYGGYPIAGPTTAVKNYENVKISSDFIIIYFKSTFQNIL